MMMTMRRRRMTMTMMTMTMTMTMTSSRWSKRGNIEKTEGVRGWVGNVPRLCPVCRPRPRQSN
eukprot:COSAG05_NODE_130_length_17165_cov_154.623638_30_plen_63_part_00